jgi:hypothetical protein
MNPPTGGWLFHLAVKNKLYTNESIFPKEPFNIEYNVNNTKELYQRTMDREQ